MPQMNLNTTQLLIYGGLVLLVLFAVLILLGVVPGLRQSGPAEV